jgi:hypothetical protein
MAAGEFPPSHPTLRVISDNKEIQWSIDLNARSMPWMNDR